MKKESKIYGIFNFKCPRCHEGDLFISKNNFSPFGFTKMHKSCSVCNQTYNPEPGFYFGAAYISYAIGTVIVIASALIVLALGYRSLTPIIVGLAIPVILLAPYNYRLSRSIWAHIFIRYKKNVKKYKQQSTAN